jgi:hypothetical protein
MKTLLAVGLLCFTAVGANASVDYVKGVPTMEAQMVKTGQGRGFFGVSKAKLTLTEDDYGVQGMILKYKTPAMAYPADGELPYSSRTVTKMLDVTDVKDEGCGSVSYTARLRNEVSVGGETDASSVQGERFSVHLVDHTARRCRDYTGPKWVAEVHSGFGICGTMDSHMTLEGNPEHLVHR